MIYPHLGLFCLIEKQKVKVFYSIPGFHTSLSDIKKITKCEDLTEYSTSDLNVLIPKYMTFKLTNKQLNINYSFYIKNSNVLIKFDKVFSISKLKFGEAESFISKQISNLKKIRKQLNAISNWLDIIKFISNKDNDIYTIFDLSYNRMPHFLKFIDNCHINKFKKYYDIDSNECSDEFKKESEECVTLIYKLMDRIMESTEISFSGYGGIAFYIEKTRNNGIIRSHFKKAWATAEDASFGYKPISQSTEEFTHEYNLPREIYKYLAYYKMIGSLDKFKHKLQQEILKLI